MAPDLRTVRTKTVHFDNSTVAPKPRRPRPRTPRVSQLSQGGDDDSDSHQVEGDSGRWWLDEDEGEESADEGVVAINTLIELKRVIDNVKGVVVSGASLKMTAWVQPGNEIDEEAISGELESIRTQNYAWSGRWLINNGDRYADLRSTHQVRAEVTHKGLKEPYRFELDYDEPSSYLAVYEMVKRMWEEDAKTVRLTVVEHFQARPKTPTPSQGQPTPVAGSSSQATKRRRDTATDRHDRIKQLQRDADRVTGNFVSDIYQHWTCHVTTCSNWSKACYIDAGEHFALSTEDLSRWSAAIDAGKADVQKMPEGLLASVLYRRMKEPRSMKARVKRDDDLTRLPFVLNIGTPPSQPAVASEPRSSPPHQEGRDLHNIALYLDWLVSDGSLTAEHAQLAKDGLSERGFGWNFLREVTDNEWGDMRVPRGAKLVILKRQKAWQRYRIKERVIQSRNRLDDGIIDLSDEE